MLDSQGIAHYNRRVTQALAIDPATQKQAKEYARLRRRLMFFDLAVSGLFTVAWLGWSGPLKRWLTPFATHEWLLVLLLGGLFFLITPIVGPAAGLLQRLCPAAPLWHV